MTIGRSVAICAVALLCLSVTNEAAGAQIAQGRMTPAESLYQQQVASVYARIASQFALTPLGDSAADSVRFELRVWESPGLGTESGWIIRHDSSGWRGLRAEHRDGANRLRMIERPVTGSWEEIWNRVRGIGLLEMATFGGPRDGRQTADGQMGLVELRTGSTYLSWTYVLRDPAASPDVARMVTLLRFMRSQAP